MDQLYKTFSMGDKRNERWIKWTSCSFAEEIKMLKSQSINLGLKFCSWITSSDLGLGMDAAHNQSVEKCLNC